MTQVATGSSISKTVRNGVMVAGLIASLMVGSLVLQGDRARGSDGGTRVDSLAAGCGAAKDQHGALSEANSNDSGLAGILQQVRDTGQTRSNVCGDTPGSSTVMRLTGGNSIGAFGAAKSQKAPLETGEPVKEGVHLVSNQAH